MNPETQPFRYPEPEPGEIAQESLPDALDLTIRDDYEHAPGWLPFECFELVQAGYPFPNHGVMVCRPDGGTDKDRKLLPSKGPWCKTTDAARVIDELRTALGDLVIIASTIEYTGDSKPLWARSLPWAIEAALAVYGADSPPPFPLNGPILLNPNDPETWPPLAEAPGLKDMNVSVLVSVNRLMMDGGWARHDAYTFVTARWDYEKRIWRTSGTQATDDNWTHYMALPQWGEKP